MRANRSFAFVSSRCVVTVQVIAELSGSGQELIFFFVKGFVSIEQDVGNLSGGNVDANVAKLFQQAVLGDVILMDLQENVMLQTEAKVRADVSGSLCNAKCSIRQTIDGPAVTDIVGLNDEILNDEVAIPFEKCARRQIVRHEDDVLIDV